MNFYTYFKNQTKCEYYLIISNNNYHDILKADSVYRSLNSYRCYKIRTALGVSNLRIFQRACFLSVDSDLPSDVYHDLFTVLFFPVNASSILSDDFMFANQLASRIRYTLKYLLHEKGVKNV